MLHLTASIDDGCKYDWKIADLFLQFNIPVTYYVTVNHRSLAMAKNTEPIDNREIKRMLKSGVELGSHTVTHSLLTRISQDQALSEIVDSKRMLENMFDEKISKFCYPRGYANAWIETAVEQAGYKSARGVTVGSLLPTENKYYQATTLHAGYDRKEYAGLTWVQYGLKMLEQAQTMEHAYYHIWCHGWELEKYPNGFESLKLLIKKLKKG